MALRAWLCYPPSAGAPFVSADGPGVLGRYPAGGKSLIESLTLAVVVTLVVTGFLLPVARWLAWRTGTITRPRADRLSQRSVPTLGGIALVGGVLAGTTIGLRGGQDLLPLLALVGGMAILGFIDDVGTIGPLARLALQSVAAMVFVAAVSNGLDAATRVSAIAIAAIAVPLAVNATNLVDNADGLAASLSAVTALTLAGLGAVTGIGGSTMLFALVIAAACLLFLALQNRPPATMFMGDVGSLGLGFALAAATILLVRDAVTGPSSGLIAALLFPLAWGVQLSDLALVFVTRLRRGTSPLRGGVDHTSHRLLLLDMSPVSMLVALALLAGMLGTVAVLVGRSQSAPSAIAAVAIAAAILIAFEVWLVSRTERHFAPEHPIPTSGAASVHRSGTSVLAASPSDDDA